MNIFHQANSGDGENQKACFGRGNVFVQLCAVVINSFCQSLILTVVIFCYKIIMQLASSLLFGKTVYKPRAKSVIF